MFYLWFVCVLVCVCTHMQLEELGECRMGQGRTHSISETNTFNTVKSVNSSRGGDWLFELNIHPGIWDPLWSICALLLMQQHGRYFLFLACVRMNERSLTVQQHRLGVNEIRLHINRRILFLSAKQTSHCSTGTRQH